MAVMVREIFIGEPELCLEVREEHVQKIFEIICQRKEAAEQMAQRGELAGEREGIKELLAILQTIAKVHFNTTFYVIDIPF